MVETIRFRKIYLEDLRTGSGTESVTLADGSIVALTKISLSSLGGAGSLDYLELAEQSATPSTPGSGTVRIYRKTDNKQYLLDDAGTETEWPFTVGTITSGVWNGTAIAVGYGGTGLATYVIGDLLYASATTTLAKLAAVASGQILTSQGAATAPAWSNNLGAFSYYINDTANAKMTVGLTINQGANDDEILALKSSDVAHGMTTLAETDTYATFSKVAAAGGGLFIRGLLDSGDQAVAIYIVGTAVTASTAKTTGAAATIRLDSRLKSGTGETGSGADANLVIISDNSTGRFIFDAEGSAHADVEWVAFQGHDDIQLLTDLEAEFDHRKNGRPEDAQSQARTAQLRAEKIVNFHTPGQSRAMVDTTRLAMLKVGAIRQLAARVKALEQRP